MRRENGCALVVMRRENGNDDVKVGGALFSIGKIFERLGQFENAEIQSTPPLPIFHDSVLGL
jgi:hypothetical protein